MIHLHHLTYFRTWHKELSFETSFREWMLTAHKENIFLFAIYQSLSKQSCCRWYRGCLGTISARDTTRHGLCLFTIWNSFLVFFLSFRSSQFCSKAVEVCYNSFIDRRIDHCAILHWMNLLGQMSHSQQYFEESLKSKWKIVCVYSYRNIRRSLCSSAGKTAKSELNKSIYMTIAKSWPHEIC